MDIIDANWSDLLLSHIPKMLEGNDRFSYELTLASIAHNLHDAHIIFFGAEGFSIMWDIFDNMFGGYYVLTWLAEAEGYLLVLENDRDLLRGDVILRVNGVDIDEVTQNMLRYLPFPNEEKALRYLVRDHVILRQQTIGEMALDILRDGVEIRVYVNAHREVNNFFAPSDSRTHVLLDNNIGLINNAWRDNDDFFPGIFSNELLHDIMNDFEDTNGLIIDMRQGALFLQYALAEYLIEEPMHFATISTPMQFIPGMFADNTFMYSGHGFVQDEFQRMTDMGFEVDHIEPLDSFLYKNPVVILIDERVQSNLEFVVMSLRNGSNVTVMGSNTIGANGDVVFLPLPGEIEMMFTGLGIYTSEGEQTQRIGLSPDIYVPRTVAGIRDGRDELMEAAIQFILN